MTRPSLLVSARPLVSVLIFLALFAGFQGGRYFMANRLQEVGILSALTLFTLGAWITLFRLPQAEWKRWVYTPCLLIAGIMVTWSATFGLRYGESVLYSLFASREFMLAFIAPALFLMVRAGYPMPALMRVIWFCLLALLLNYLYFYHTMDLRAAFFSADHTVSNLVTYDEWRGFRLKPSMFPVMLSLLGGVTLLFNARHFAARLYGLLLAGLAVYIWTIVQFRSNLATMLLAILIYWVFLVRPGRFPLLLLVLPLAVIAAPIVADIILNHFQQADGGSLRLNSYALALSNIPQHPFLGVGEDNSYGRTYQDLFARTFYPSDLGIIGIAFKYGLTGTLLYLFFHFRIWTGLWQTNYRLRQQSGEHHPLIWGCLIVMTAQTLNLPLIPGLAYAQGITMGATCVALCALLHPAAATASGKLQNKLHSATQIVT